MACGLGAVQLATPGAVRPIDPGHAATACGAIVTTVVVIFLDTSGAAFGAFLALLAGLATLVGGLLVAGTPEVTPTPMPPPRGAGEGGHPLPGFYPDPRTERRLRWWDGREWTDRTDA